MTGVKGTAHWVQNFPTYKNKYDLALCQSRLHTASETFVCHKKKLDRFSAFSDGKDRNTEKRMQSFCVTLCAIKNAENSVLHIRKTMLK